MSNEIIVNYKKFEFEDSDVFYLDYECLDDYNCDDEAMLTREEAFDLLKMFETEVEEERYTEICKAARKRINFNEDYTMIVFDVYAYRVRTDQRITFSNDDSLITA